MRAIADPEIAANYIRAWLITDMTANLRVFLSNALSWNSQLIGVLDRTIEETDDTALRVLNMLTSF